ncbi:hypothetical protein L208DRAFT_1381171 [Tricholoma matsutake]|nr:hypothetical protein L208DRAFT_1381171 [Tricholoma matsutake 945]
MPQLDHYKGDIRKLYHMKGQKYCATLRKSQIQPLPTNGKNETVTSDLAKSLQEIFGHIGQTDLSYTQQLIFTGGNGLTYECMVQLKNYLQFHDDAYKWLDILEPLLEIWHTKWTDLSRIYEAHWDSLINDDPSTLGHSANKIKWKAPGNIKKVDYYPYSQLAYLVLDARMLDCWRKDGDLLKFFELQAVENKLLSFQAFLEIAEELQRMYGSPAAYHRALDGTYENDATNIPKGSVWWPLAKETSSLDIEQKQKGSSKKKGKESDEKFVGDLNMLFTFAGSAHHKYASYLLKMICSLELKSIPELKISVFKHWLVNPSGLPGHWIEGDLYQEQLQDELYKHIGRKDAGFAEKNGRTYGGEEAKVDHSGKGYEHLWGGSIQMENRSIIINIEEGDDETFNNEGRMEYDDLDDHKEVDDNEKGMDEAERSILGSEEVEDWY